MAPRTIGKAPGCGQFGAGKDWETPVFLAASTAADDQTGYTIPFILDHER
ncbi:MAG: hypothetical protein AAFO63_02010 [Pseudomonadota bacterium]